MSPQVAVEQRDLIHDEGVHLELLAAAEGVFETIHSDATQVGGCDVGLRDAAHLLALRF